MTVPANRRHSWLTAAAVALLLLVHVALALSAVRNKSVTVDEIFHITGGYLFDQFNDFRIHTDNGVMPQRLHALPAVLTGATPPPLSGNEYWRVSDVQVIAHQFFYESGNDHWPILMRARAVNLLFGLGLCLTVFLWARRLAGDCAGLTALALAALSPTLLAHGPLTTTDAAAAFLLTASVGLFWWQLRSGGRWPLAASAVVFGLACVAKYSAVLLLPIFVLLIIVQALTTSRGRTLRPMLILAIHGLVAWSIIWAFFAFRYSAFAPDLPPGEHLIRPWDWLLSRMGWQASVINFLRASQLLPEGFLFGYTNTYVGSLSRGAFLAGDYGLTGWVEFFPLAFLWKSTPAELAGLMVALIAAALRWRCLRDWALRLAPLLALAAVYGAAALASHLNIGHRHLLPLYPGLCIVAGIATWKIAAAPRLRLGLAAGLIAVQAVTAIRIYPHYLAYFNPLAGGPANGWRLLVDSSLDWGQDLPGLKLWLDSNNAGADRQPVFLSYFGSGDPRYYDIRATWLPFVNGFKFIHNYYEPRAGIYCISATMLQQVYSPARGPWTLDFEREYQQLRRLRQEDFSAVTWQRFDILRLARLCTYLRARRPDAVVGHSIFIYRLTEAELEAATQSRYSDWLRAIETAQP